MLKLAAIFIGGGIGTVFRYLVNSFCGYYIKTGLPIATFSVNVIGCFILGFVVVFLFNKPVIGENLKPVLTVGLCGGLTTFSTLSLEVLEMINANQYITALLYFCLSFIVGVLAVYMGGCCAKIL